MRRSFLTRTIICLIPTLIATALVVWAYFKDPVHFSGFKRGIDLSGGTILVYEVDQDASRQLSGGDPGSGGRAKADATLAGALKRRIDPADLLGVVVRPIGESRVELILPYGARTEGGGEINQSEVEKVKGLIREVGSLEFRTVSNYEDDRDGIAAAQEYFDKAIKEPESDEAKSVDAAARSGLPPPFPNKSSDDPQPFTVFNDPVQYAWVELGKNQRADLGLSTVNPRSGRNGLNLTSAFDSQRTTGRIVQHGQNAYWSRATNNEKIGPEEREKKKYDYFVLTRVSEKDRVLVGGDVSITAFVDQGKTGEPVIGFNFNSRGAEKFYQMTSRNQPSGPETGGRVFRQLGIILDGYLISEANINEPIRARGQISGSFDRPYVERIVTLLRSGALPATLKPLPVSENTIGPTLGADTIRNGTRAVGLAYIAILVFMIIYYRFAGFVATVALLANLLLTIGFMVAVNATFTLPGMAGLVLMLGMAVDANVLIYERVREERDRGMNLPTALRNGYDRAFGTIIDTHLTSIFTAIVLYAVGNDQLKGFGVSLTVGLIISLFTSLYMTRLLFDFWQSKNWLTQLRMMRFFTRPNINFMKVRHLMFAITGFLTIAGLGLFLARGKQGLNVDFIGGTAYSGLLAQPMEIGELRKLLDEERQKTQLAVEKVEEVVDPSGKTKNTYEITFRSDKQSTIVALANAPEGATKPEREEAVKLRASILPDASVEQIFTAGNAGAAGSALFTIRTTERERELVETAINRLFKDDQGKDLLKKNRVEKYDPVQGGDYVMTFEEPVSKSAIRTLLEREFQARMGDQYPAADVFDVVELGEAKEGRHKEMKVRVLKDANPGIQNLIAAGQVKDVIEAVAADFAERPQPERLETFDGTLASETQNRALYAILASWAAILLYLWFRFGSWTFGLAAILCLVHDLCFTLGAIALSHYIYDTWVGKALMLQDFKIDLPAVAALLTLVGYSVNEIIVNFARIREVRGKNPLLTHDTINSSVNQTLSRTILTSTTVFLVSVVLYVFGGEGIHLFAFVMMMGVLISTYSSIYIASPLLLLLGEGKVRHHGYQPVTEPASQPA